MTSGYWGEFRTHWPNLLGACVAIALGASIYNYLGNVLAPPLLRDLGWTRAEFAATGSFGVISLIAAPLAGRLVDRFGVRIGAAVGFTVLPLCFLAFSLMSGNLYEFYAISLVQMLFGVLTSSVVFSRVIIERFDAARGMSLSVLMTGAPLAGALLAVPMERLVAAEGWRTGFQVLAALSFVAGMIGIALIGRGGQRSGVTSEKLEWRTFVALLRNPVFALIVAGMFLCNVPQFLVASQLSLLLIENGSNEAFGAVMLSLYAMTVVAGRFVTGIALDRVSPQSVALVALGLPALGYVGLALPYDPRWLLAVAVMLIGLAQGAEGDIGAYLTSRSFPVGNFSMIYGFVMASLILASSLGSLMLSAVLQATDRFAPFLWIAAAATLLGAFSFYWTGRFEPKEIVP